MDVYGVEPDLKVILPKAYWVPATATEVIARMKVHGLQMETIEDARMLTLDMVRLEEPKLGNVNEGHVPLSAKSYRHATQDVNMPKGSVRVPTDQPLGLLAAAMLEAESADSFLAWNFFPSMLQRTEYIEGYAIAPLAEAMMERDPALKAEFEAKLASDPAFAASASARLEWFYKRSAYYDANYLLYPVGREM